MSAYCHTSITHERQRRAVCYNAQQTLTGRAGSNPALVKFYPDCIGASIDNPFPTRPNRGGQSIIGREESFGVETPSYSNQSTAHVFVFTLTP